MERRYPHLKRGDHKKRIQAHQYGVYDGLRSPRPSPQVLPRAVFTNPPGNKFHQAHRKLVQKYGYGYKFTEAKFNQLIMTVTIDDAKLRQAPGYNKAKNIVDGRTPDISPHPRGLSEQEIPEKGFFDGVESALGINNYPPVDIETRHHITSSDNYTVSSLEKSAVDQAMEARDPTKKKSDKPKPLKKKLTT